MNAPFPQKIIIHNSPSGCSIHKAKRDGKADDCGNNAIGWILLHLNCNTRVHPDQYKGCMRQVFITAADVTFVSHADPPNLIIHYIIFHCCLADSILYTIYS